MFNIVRMNWSAESYFLVPVNIECYYFIFIIHCLSVSRLREYSIEQSEIIILLIELLLINSLQVGYMSSVNLSNKGRLNKNYFFLLLPNHGKSMQFVLYDN